MRELWRIDSNDGEIGVRIIACQFGWILASIRQVYTDRVRLMNNVAVRENKSIRGNHKPGAVPAEFMFSTSCGNALFYVDVHYRGCDARHCAHYGARIRVQQIRVVGLCHLANWP